MLETLTRLMLPIPAARSALSKALSGVVPSALPEVVAALVTGFQPIRSSPSSLIACTARRLLVSRRILFLGSCYRVERGTQEKSGFPSHLAGAAGARRRRC